MYLFINTCLTDKRKGPTRPVSESRVDIFKYCISSLAVIPFNEVFIYYTFYEDEQLKLRQEEVNNHIKKEFKNTKLNLFNYRNEYQTQWKQALEPIINGPYNSVWYLCNDDHIFIESKLDTILSVQNILENSDENIALYYTHWPEMLKISSLQGNRMYNDKLQYWEAINYDSVLLMHKKILYNWWFEHDYGNEFMPRSDWFGGITVRGPSIKILTPLREQCRHFEGYPHVNIPENKCPSLKIPHNFFNGFDVSCYQDIESYTTIPNEHIFTHNDIPLFWKTKINKLEINGEPDYNYRSERIVTLANSRPNEEHIPIHNDLILKAYE